ncbi:MAG: twin-arginine translocase TatA/TatE family subunit [Alsobacter sp.]|nr:twin-arginine translocase TatA/TatE family subunit [Burkholderiales bacterium]
MGGVSIWHWIVVGIVVMLLFGRGKVSELMGDVAKGIKAFKKGMTEEEAAEAAKPAEPVKTIGDQRPAPATTVQAAADERKVS